MTVIFKQWKVCGCCGERFSGTDGGTVMEGLVWFDCPTCNSTLCIPMERTVQASTGASQL